jgi:probable phosphoglycerate mutase
LSASVLLVRHAEDRAAAGARFGDEGLSERGREQARALGAALAAVPLAQALCSPLLRARETAELALAGRGLPLRVEACLAEGSVGALAGLPVDEARARYPQYFRLGRSVVARLAASGRTAPGGETREEFLERVDRAGRLVSEALERDAGAVVVFSHGGLLNHLLQNLIGVPPRDVISFRFPHCAVAKLVRHGEPPGFGPFTSLGFEPWPEASRSPG